MILTTCPACAAPLARDAPRCVRCKLRYCSATCQHDHWRRGHKQMCKKIHRGGNAEFYHANKKYKEAVAVAVEACADDTKGQTCYICMEGATEKEGLVSGFCACRGTTSYAHVTCLVGLARGMVDASRDDNWNEDDFMSAFGRWNKCSLCLGYYRDPVRCALGWACWKTYLERPENHEVRLRAMELLGQVLRNHNLEEALAVYRALLATKLHLTQNKRADFIFETENDVADCLEALGRIDEFLALRREIHSSLITTHRYNTGIWYQSAVRLALALMRHHRYAESLKLLRAYLSSARETFGPDDFKTLELRYLYAHSLYHYHFIGNVNYRADYQEAIEELANLKYYLGVITKPGFESGFDGYLELNDAYGKHIHDLLAYAQKHRLE